MADKNPKRAMELDGDANEVAQAIRDDGANEVVTNFNPDTSEYVTIVSTLAPACTGTGKTPLEAVTNAQKAFKVYRGAHGE